MNGIITAEILMHTNMIDPEDVERVIDLELAAVKRDLLDAYEQEMASVDHTNEV